MPSVCIHVRKAYSESEETAIMNAVQGGHMNLSRRAVRDSAGGRRQNRSSSSSVRKYRVRPSLFPGTSLDPHSSHRHSADDRTEECIEHGVHQRGSQRDETVAGGRSKAIPDRRKPI